MRDLKERLKQKERDLMYFEKENTKLKANNKALIEKCNELHNTFQIQKMQEFMYNFNETNPKAVSSKD